MILNKLRVITSQVDDALKKNHKTYFRGFFLLRVLVIIDGQPAQIEQGWLTFRSSTTKVAVTFYDLCAKVSAAMQKYSIQITNYFCDDAPLFQLNVSSASHLQKLLDSMSKLQEELTTQISLLFKKKTQVHLLPQVYLILPSASNSNGKIIHVTADNAVQSMALWEGSAAFTFQDIFQQWNDYSSKNEPILGQPTILCIIYSLLSYLIISNQAPKAYRKLLKHWKKL